MRAFRGSISSEKKRANTTVGRLKHRRAMPMRVRVPPPAYGVLQLKLLRTADVRGASGGLRGPLGDMLVTNSSPRDEPRRTQRHQTGCGALASVATAGRRSLAGFWESGPMAKALLSGRESLAHPSTFDPCGCDLTLAGSRDSQAARARLPTWRDPRRQVRGIMSQRTNAGGLRHEAANDVGKRGAHSSRCGCGSLCCSDRRGLWKRPGSGHEAGRFRG